VNVDFDPAAHFASHMAGEPSHCLTRSAILATQLLSVGIPARVVQFVPAVGKGHTLVGVWDETIGWIVVDPTNGGFVTGPMRQPRRPNFSATPPTSNGSRSTRQTYPRRSRRPWCAISSLCSRATCFTPSRGSTCGWGSESRPGPSAATMRAWVPRSLLWEQRSRYLLGRLALVTVGWRRSREQSRALQPSSVRGGVSALGEFDTPPPA
jgi:hypothetical protein